MSTGPTGDAAEVERRLRLPLVEAMSTQRAIRRLGDEPVEPDVVLRLVELALKAPSGGNSQPQRFVVVTDPATRARLARLNAVAWRVARTLYVRAGARAGAGERDRRLLAAVDHQARHLADVPVLVVVCSARRIRSWPPILATSGYGSVYPAVQNLLLAARAVGLGAGLVTLPLWSVTLARRALGLPRRVRPVAVVPLGWPRGRYGPTRRRDAAAVTHLDRYGNRPWLAPGSAG